MTAERIAWAALIVVAYAALCLAIWVRERRVRRKEATDRAALSTGAGRPIVVGFASQTGFAESLALQTARAVGLGGLHPRLAPLGHLDVAALQEAECALFVASTYGEGDPPDSASSFVDAAMRARPDLSRLRFGILALGDSSYANFCAFGRRLEAWLLDRGAQPLFDRIEMDNEDPAALARWGSEIERLSGAAPIAWEQQPFEPWRLAARRVLNEGSAGNVMCHLEFAPPSEARWEAGDLVQLRVPSDPIHPREYSIASLPFTGTLHLLVRKEIHPDGTPGAASGWLTGTLAIGETVPLRLRPNNSFRLGENASRPMILIGNGSGLAGLRAHLMAREALPGSRNWLLFGERNRAHDLLYGDELEAWRARGVLEELDLVFSRDGTGDRYVQDRLRSRAADVRRWLEAGASIYVCGSLKGMSAGVHEALLEILGAPAVEEFQRTGRYRRDVY